MRKVTSREYKVMLEHGGFADGKSSVESFWDEISDLAKSLGVDAKGDFRPAEKRSIVFLDTPDFTLRRNGVVLRRREAKDGGEVQYTLKCRSEDRYITNGTDLSAGDGLEDDSKFEEDIAAPFRSRFSQSNTVTFSEDKEPGVPDSLKEAGALFPVLRELERDGAKCPGSTPLKPVNNVKAYERVFKGPELRFEEEDASVAVILWSNGSKGRPLVAEYSFRYKDKKEDYSPAVAKSARHFFEAIQRLDWVRPDGMTKTQYVYRGTA
jgi:hypothetical protein